MRGLWDAVAALLEEIGFEVARVSFGDLFPGALIGVVLAALVGGGVSDLAGRSDHPAADALPWDWMAAVAAFLGSVAGYYALFLA